MPKKITLMSWNVNGIRAVERKGFLEWLAQSGADVLGIQETKTSHPDQLSHGLKNPDGYVAFWHYATEKKGYSGTAVYTKLQLLSVKTEFGGEVLSREGRVLELEFPEFTFLTIYFPNGGSGDARLAYKLRFYDEFLKYVSGLVARGKKVVFCGDVNTAHKAIDLARPKENEKTSGFMLVEREWLDKFEQAGFIDTFRMFHPDTTEQYTWWDMKTRARGRNTGWRIDYFYVSENMRDQIEDAFILQDVEGSDHCPVGVVLEV
jgi:exodeoxyribonuclease-3